MPVCLLLAIVKRRWTGNTMAKRRQRGITIAKR
jgi:hypothetical protein